MERSRSRPAVRRRPMTSSRPSADKPTPAPRTALVTGAGRRVGRAIAVALGARGMRVAVHYHASDDDARETVRLIREAGGDAITVCADLRDPRAPERLIAQTVEQLGTLDVLVNS